MNDTPADDPAARYLGTAEVAERLNTSTSRVGAFVRGGEFPNAIDVSGRHGTGRPRYRVPLADVRAFESRRAVAAKAPAGAAA